MNIPFIVWTLGLDIFFDGMFNLRSVFQGLFSICVWCIKSLPGKKKYQFSWLTDTIRLQTASSGLSYHWHYCDVKIDFDIYEPFTSCFLSPDTSACYTCLIHIPWHRRKFMSMLKLRPPKQPSIDCCVSTRKAVLVPVSHLNMSTYCGNYLNSKSFDHISKVRRKQSFSLCRATAVTNIFEDWSLVRKNGAETHRWQQRYKTPII